MNHYLSSLWKRHRDAVLMIYAVGNALTFAYLVKAQADLIHGGGNLTSIVLEALFFSFFWPVYWILQIAG